MRVLCPTTPQIDDKAVRKAASKLESVESALREHPLANHPELRARLALVQQRQELEEAILVSDAVLCDASLGQAGLHCAGHL